MRRKDVGLDQEKKREALKRSRRVLGWGNQSWEVTEEDKGTIGPFPQLDTCKCTSSPFAHWKLLLFAQIPPKSYQLFLSPQSLLDSGRDARQLLLP